MAEIFVTLAGISVRLGGIPLLDGIDWTIRRGEQWVVTGPSGSGKTLLAHTLMGRHFYNGQIDFPVLTLHTKGDGLVVVQNESAYRHVVDEEGNGELLRRDFIDRAGHCAFTPAETIAAVEKLLDRLKTGQWHDRTAAELNASAAALGPAFNIFASSSGAIVATPPAFIDLIPGPYLRPFDLGDDDRGHGGRDNAHGDGNRGGNSY